MENYSSFRTEGVLEESKGIDKMSSAEIARVINEQDKTVAFAVEKAIPQIAEGIDILAECLKNGGRIFYCGAGTSGRLGVLDASECPPTYGVSAETVQGVIAGGKQAAFSSIEDAEDSADSITDQLKERHFSSTDVCVGISASGSALCVQSAMKYAHSLGARTICVTNNPDSALIPLADAAAVAVVGAEVIKGSTRMKAGTAQKMILNMLSTGAMVRAGRTYGNLMAYMIPSNKKLVARAVRMVTVETGCTDDEAMNALEANGMTVADAIRFLKNEKNNNK